MEWGYGCLKKEAEEKIEEVASEMGKQNCQHDATRWERVCVRLQEEEGKKRIKKKELTRNMKIGGYWEMVMNDKALFR